MSVWPFEDAMHKNTLHVDLLLPVQQASARILALLSHEASSLCSSLKIFNSEKIACSAVKSPVQLISKLLLWWQPEVSHVIKAMIPN